MLSASGLTLGEALVIDRRRKGIRQAEAANMLGMPLGAYKQAEKDRAPQCWAVPRPSIGKMMPHEVCHLMRLREGLTLDELARKVGMSKWWLCLIEAGRAPVSSLLTYWHDRK